MVYADRHPRERDTYIGRVGVDNTQAAESATSYLLSLGHRDIGIIRAMLLAGHRGIDCGDLYPRFAARKSAWTARQFRPGTTTWRAAISTRCSF